MDNSALDMVDEAVEDEDNAYFFLNKVELFYDLNAKLNKAFSKKAIYTQKRINNVLLLNRKTL